MQILLVHLLLGVLRQDTSEVRRAASFPLERLQRYAVEQLGVGLHAEHGLSAIHRGEEGGIRAVDTITDGLLLLLLLRWL